MAKLRGGDQAPEFELGKKAARSHGVGGPGRFIHRPIFLVDGGGVVRYRHVALFGLRYQALGDLERAVAGVETGGSSASPSEPPRA